MKENENKWMMYVVILLFLTIGILFAKLNVINDESEGEVLAQASSGNGECYTDWDGIECAEGFTAIIKGKWTVVTDPYFIGDEFGYGYGCPLGAGDRICANIPDKNEIATWGLVVEQSNIDCAICCKI